MLNANEGDSHHRAASSLAASFRPLPYLALVFQYDNRYDRHSNLEEGDGSDDGWLAESRLGARFVHKLTPELGLGLETMVWFPPGGEPPSFDFGGTSVETRALATYNMNDALRVSGNVGFRYDNSVESVDNADMLSTADRLALGVSDSNAVLAGVGATYSFGNFDVLAEGTWDILIGSDAPDLSESPLRFGAGIRMRATDSIQIQLVAEASPSKVGDFTTMGTLYRVDPSFSTMFTLSYSYPLKQADQQIDCVRFPSDARCPKVEEVKKDPGKLKGTITDEGGNPISGAAVTLVIQPREPGKPQVTVTATTGEDGSFEIADANGEPLPDGAAELTVEAEGFDAKKQNVDIVAGKLSEVSVPMSEALPPGVLRGAVQSFRGKPLKATITVEPGDKTATADPQGQFEIELEPGEYKVKISAGGFKTQTRTVTIEKNGVTIMNVDMRNK
ncbi:MAG: carboxypeptidase-like regulatory domain-containing protein [Deltaproteobacteria bacterium]|nr:carboxypeptidase-like regulatory domain-containing protein [Deltaproteobacteria bacterium]